MSANTRQHGFKLTGALIGGQHKPVARFKCWDCEAITDVSVHSNEPLNLESLTHTAIQRGWAADPFRPNRVFCALHKEKRGERRNDPDSELKKLEAKMTTTPLPVPTLKPPVVAIREPTSDQRAMVRKLLEEHFDEDLGCYLDGFSDETVAEQAKLPRMIIERIRGAAYGPIRVTQEVLDMQKEVGRLRAKIDDMAAAGAALQEQLNNDLQQLRSLLLACQERVGKLVPARAA